MGEKRELGATRAKVLVMRRDGWSNKDIAAELGLSEGTVGWHIHEAGASKPTPRRPPEDRQTPAKKADRLARRHSFRHKPDPLKPVVVAELLSPRMAALLMDEGWVATQDGRLLPPRAHCPKTGPLLRGVASPSNFTFGGGADGLEVD